jgi:hypothetical protein
LCSATYATRRGHTATWSRYFTCWPVGRQNFVQYNAALFESLLTIKKTIHYSNTWPLFGIGLQFSIPITSCVECLRWPEY